LFKPVSRDETRRDLGMEGFTLLSVGYLDPRKGHHLIIQALTQLAGVRLMIAGSGPERGRLEALARALGVAGRVTFLGPLTQDVLRQYYGATDALVLASSREGWANVLLEAMACGTPVVASNVWGTPEVVRAPAAGVLMEALTAQGVADGVRRLRATYPDHAATRAYAQDFGWGETTRGQIRLFHNAAMRPLPQTRPVACKADAIRDLH
jgi:glycosyltransferase involved in cell wall biosynthesis